MPYQPPADNASRDHAAILRSAAWDLSHAASEFTRLKHNIDQALTIIDTFPSNANPQAIKHALLQDWAALR